MTRAKMSEADIALFNDSLERCTGHPDFQDRFYESFLASSPQVREKFRNTDFRRQKRMIRLSFYLLLSAVMGEAEGDAHLERIAALHGQSNLDIQPALFELWLQALLQAVKEVDPAYDQDVERVWRVVMQHGIDFMKAHYRPARETRAHGKRAYGA